jgi:hypothetical protein
VLLIRCVELLPPAWAIAIARDVIAQIEPSNVFHNPHGGTKLFPWAVRIGGNEDESIRLFTHATLLGALRLAESELRTQKKTAVEN